MMLYLIGAVVFSFLSGAFTVIFIVLYFLFKYRDDLFQHDQKPQVEYQKNQLGKLLRHNLHNGTGISTLGEKESCCFVNMLFAFIFREWRDTNQLQNSDLESALGLWVLKKINIEFMEFMETKTASRLLNGLKIHDVSLGTNFPVFNSVKIEEPFSFTGDELPETVVLEVDMEYLGGFYLAIDVDLVFGKTAFLAVRITYVKGRIRLHFGRQPCTHWSFCFVEEPVIKFDVETSFETRQLPQLTSLIVNQIRRTIRRKHTFPHYKMRYNPFFSFQHPAMSPFDGFINEISIQPAKLEICVTTATRLLISPKGEKERSSESPNYVVFATLSVNTESCVGKAVLNFVSAPSVAEKNENSDVCTQSVETPTTSKSTQSNQPKSPSTPFDSLQRSLFGPKKDSSKKFSPSPSGSSLPLKPEETFPTESDNTTKIKRTDSTSSTSSSSSGPTYVMVALNFGATLREEMRDDGQKAVVVENITEHNVHGQSGMKNGDTVVELNGIPITSLSQAIGTIEKIRAKKEAFKFKVRRSRQDLDSTGLNQSSGMAATDSDKSNTSLDTESDHSDIESVDEYQDFVNISLQVAELHMKEGSKSKRKRSSSNRQLSVPEDDVSRPHSNSLSSSNNPSADAPYMTLGSSPTPTTSTQSLKDEPGDEKVPPGRKVEKDSVKKRIDKIISPRSRSESPPIFRNASTKQLTPVKARNGVGKVENSKKEFPMKRSPSPTPSLLDTIFPELADTSKTRASKATAEKEKQNSSKTAENLSYARVDDDPESQLYKTSLVNSNQREYSWNGEKFAFDFKERHRYLNIRYWVQQVSKQGVIRAKPPQIVGCVSVPLCEIEMHCRGTSSRRVTRRFPLSAPNELLQDNRWFLNDPVSHRPSFREEYCYGDTTLTIKLLPNQGNKNNSSNCLSNLDSAGMYFADDDTNGMMTKEILNKLSQKSGSDYLLSAATPKGRRLLVSQQTQTGDKDPPSPAKQRVASDAMLTGEKSNESGPETQDDIFKGQKKAGQVSLARMLKGFLHGGKPHQDPKKVSHFVEDEPSTSEDQSAENMLNDVTVGVFTNQKTGLHQFELVKFSRATKCSYCHNKLWTKTGLQCMVCDVICHKRCVEKFKKDFNCLATEVSTENLTMKKANHYEGSNSANTIIAISSASETDEGASSSDSDGVPTAALSFRNKILDITSSLSNRENVHSNKKSSKRQNYLLSKNSEDLLAVNAKEMGKDLHRDLPWSERKKMLASQTQEIENELHSEITEKERLLKEQKSHENTTQEYRKLGKKILKSDERLQALTLLLLHYRAGLEDCDFETIEEGMILSDDEDENYGAVGSTRQEDKAAQKE